MSGTNPFIQLLPLLLIFAWCNLKLCETFNVDTVHPIVYANPNVKDSQSYFGYTLQFLFNQTSRGSSKWLLVGAPKAESSSNVRPGLVYRCLLGNNITENCSPLPIESIAKEDSTYTNYKDNGWLGGSMAVGSPSNGRVTVCSYRWMNSKFQDQNTPPFMNGACYSNEHQISENRDFTEKLLPLTTNSNHLRQIVGEIYDYAFGQAGFSVHVTVKNATNNEIIMGAPGVYNWRGAVIRIEYRPFKINPGRPTRRKRQLSQPVEAVTSISDLTNVKQLEVHDYFGYSVHSGIFFSDGNLLYVAGAPRAAGMKGKVLMFDFLPNSKLDIREEFIGTQLGEYFGASILAVDLTNDGKAELLIGAPQHTRHPDKSDRSGDEGKVYVFRSQAGSFTMVEALYGSEVMAARFGTSMISVGDLNMDGFNDIAIGAPYEGQQGAVYIYLGGKDGILNHEKNKYWQRIAAAEFTGRLSGLTGFGISLAAADIDDNQYPDIAIGSFMSGHALIFRSRPIVKLNFTMKAENAGLVDPNGGSQDWRVCSHFTSRFQVPKICVNFTFDFDADYADTVRLRLSGNGVTDGQKPFSYTRLLSSGTSWCRTFKLTVASLPYHNQDFSRPATLRLTADLLEQFQSSPGDTCSQRADDSFNENTPGSKSVFVASQSRRERDSFCSSCPVLDETEMRQVESSLNFDTGCGHVMGKTCEEDLEIDAHFVSIRELVIGSNSASFQVRLVNHGDPSYKTKLEIELPLYAILRKIPPNLICQKPNFDMLEELLYKLTCQLDVNPFKRGATAVFEFDLDASLIPSGTNQPLSIIVEAWANGARAMGRQPRFNLTIPLKTAIDLEILGNAVDEQQTYQPPNGTDFSKVKEYATFTHVYEIRNVLPSPTNNLSIEIVLPVTISIGKDVLALVELSNTTVKATQKGSQKEIQCFPDYKSEDAIKEFFGSNPEKSQPSLKYAQANRTAFIDCFTTRNANCIRYVCSAGPLTTETPISIHLIGSVLLRSTIHFVSPKDVFILSSASRVGIVLPENVQQPDDHRPDIAIASTHFLPQGPPSALAVAAWIIVLAVFVGVLLLSILAYGMGKLGFFNRQRPFQDDTTEDNPPPVDDKQTEENEESETTEIQSS